MDENRKKLIGFFIVVLVLLMLVIGATYAYFNFSQLNQFGSQTINATTEKFESGVALRKVSDALTLNVTAEQMQSNNIGSIYYASGEETPITIGKITTIGTGIYNCSYTLSVTNSSNTESSNLYTKFQSLEDKSDGQIYLNINDDVYDFNTTTLFPITYTNSVVVNSTNESLITANLAIANTSADQTALNGTDIKISFEVSEFHCESIDESTKPVIESITKTNDEETSIVLEVNATSTNGIDMYYYKIGSEEYIGSNTNTYTFDNLLAGTEYTISVYAKDIYGLESEVKIETYSTKSKALAGETIQIMATTGLNTTMEGGLYRYQGTTADNYICFGTSSKEECIGNTDAYMYRIMGINENNQLKLIKKEALNEGVQWYSDYETDINWPQSNIYSSINGDSFLNNPTYVPNETWKSKIADTEWKYGDVRISNTNSYLDYSASELYAIENSWTDKTVPTKIGLMYAHDYYYGISGGLNCNQNGSDYPTCKTSWLHLSNNDTSAPITYEWTMSRVGVLSISRYFAWLVHSSGFVGNFYLNQTNSVRPVFYLTSDVEIIGGTGTSTDPFLIK